MQNVVKPVRLLQVYEALKAIGMFYEPEYPNWYGIDGIKFIYQNCWSDPLIEYKGKRCSCYIVEDTMRSYYREEGYEDDENKFADYMRENADEVRYLCVLALDLAMA